MSIFKIPNVFRHNNAKIAIFGIIMFLLSPVSFSYFAALGTVTAAAGDPSPTAVLFGAQGATLKRFFVIDPTNGEAGLINPSVGFDLSGLAFGPDGTLYGVQDGFIRIDHA